MSAPLKPWEMAHSTNNIGAAGQSSSLQHRYDNYARENAIGGEANSAIGLATPSLPVSADEIQGAGRPPVPPKPTTSTYTPGAFSTGYSYGGGLGGSYGAMGGMYPSYMGGGFGMGYSPYNRMNMNTTSSFMNQAEASAQGTFQSVETVVSAVSSISMMLESTYMALHNSFRAVLGVAEQFSRLKIHLSQVAASFAVFKFIRWMYRRIQVLLGLRKAGLAEDAWANAVAKSAAEAQEKFPGQQKSGWPFIVFVGLTVFLLRKIWSFISVDHGSNTGTGWTDGSSDHVVGECKYSFTANHEDELSVMQGQRINLAPAELQPRLRENDWLMASDGERTGVVPANYVRILGKRKGKPKSAEVSELNTVTSSPSMTIPTDTSPGCTETNETSTETTTSLGSPE